MPDVVVLWNEVQRREAQELHGVAAERIEVTGAQPFDRWFERRPSTARAQFCARVGLPDGPFLLFVGSTASISAPEAELKFVREWIGAVRASGSARLGGLSVLVRPHPYNTGLWGEADLSDLGDVAVWPRGGANPVDEEDRAGYFDSMFHASAVVGINTSAMIESAIVGRPVFTVRSPRFSDSQAGTLHFHYLLPEHGGFVRVADTLSEHVAQLDEALADPEGTREQIDGFVRSFVRPHGLDRKATPIVVEAIERAAARGPTTPWTMPLSRYPIRAALAAIKLVQVLRDDGQRALAVKGTATPTRRSLEAAGRAVERAGVGAGARIRDVGSSNGSAPLESLASRLEHGGAEAGRRLQERGARAERELEARGRRMLNLAKRRSRERRGERRRDQQAAVLERWRPGGGASERQPADR